MIAVSKSSLLADVRKRNSEIKKSIVKVGGGLGMQKPTLVGHAVKFFKSDSHIVSVGATVDPATNQIVNEPPPSEAKQIAHKVKDVVGETAGKFVLGSMVIGPPVIGGLLWGGTGLVVGSIISGPFVLIFVWSVLS